MYQQHQHQPQYGGGAGEMDGMGYDPNNPGSADDYGAVPAPPAEDSMLPPPPPDFDDSPEEQQPSITTSLNFDEPDGPSNMLKDNEGRLKACSFAKLISLLTAAKDNGTPI
jgi:hypothetical protein